MMLQHSSLGPTEHGQHRTAVVALFEELAELNDMLAEKTYCDDFDEVQLLIQRREQCVRRLSELHTMEVQSMMIYGEGDEQMNEIVSRVKRSSERMQWVMEKKQKSIVATISNLQHQKNYQQ